MQQLIYISAINKRMIEDGYDCKHDNCIGTF